MALLKIIISLIYIDLKWVSSTFNFFFCIYINIERNDSVLYLKIEMGGCCDFLVLVFSYRFSPPPKNILTVPFSVQVIIDTDKSSYSLRFESREHLSHVVSHINLALSRIFNNSIFAWVLLSHIKRNLHESHIRDVADNQTVWRRMTFIYLIYSVHVLFSLQPLHLSLRQRPFWGQQEVFTQLRDFSGNPEGLW